jgi:hypothetical protein
VPNARRNSGDVNRSPYHCVENPCGGNVSDSDELNDIGTSRISGASRNAISATM